MNTVEQSSNADKKSVFLDTPTPKKELREGLESLIWEFMNNGGAVQKLPMVVTSKKQKRAIWKR